jgi:hypothetical protein
MNKLKAIIFQFIAFYLASVTVVVNAQSVDEKQNIRHTINSMYDTPEHKVIVDPIVVKGKYAVASWVQKNKGGRVILFRGTEGKWDIVLCSGDAVKDPEFLIQTDIPKADAEFLAKELSSAEASISKDKVTLFDSFKGVMRNSHQPEHNSNSAGSTQDHSHR